MDASRQNSTERLRRLVIAGALAVVSASVPWPANSSGIQLPPQTKLSVTVLQWMPMKGAYEQWTALGGEFTVSGAGTVVLPVIGTVPVGDLASTALADEIAKLIQAKTGLVNRPDTTVQVLEYPPIYVVGEVTTPGQYKFSSGLTVLQALALAGGELRSNKNSNEEIQLVGDLQGNEIETLRVMARIARLQTEMKGTAEIHFPVVPSGTDGDLAAEVFAQERVILTARANEIARQTKSLSELRELFSTEIDVLQEKIKTADGSIRSAEDELTGVKTLVEKGLAVASRQSDVERTLAIYRTDRLDQVTAVMRARQNIAEATRNLEALHDKQQTEVALQMQVEQANLDQLRLKRDVSQKLLLELLASGNRSALSGKRGPVTFTIARVENGIEKTIQADESTALMAGDVVKVASPLAPPSTSVILPALPDDVSARASRSEDASQ